MPVDQIFSNTRCVSKQANTLALWIYHNPTSKTIPLHVRQLIVFMLDARLRRDYSSSCTIAVTFPSPFTNASVRR